MLPLHLSLPLVLLFLGASGAKKSTPASSSPARPPAAPPRPPPTAARKPATKSAAAAAPTRGAKKPPPKPAAPSSAADQAAVDAAVHAAIKEDIAKMNGGARTDTVDFDGKPTPAPDQGIVNPFEDVPKRSPKDAANALKAFLSKTHRFGNKTDRPDEIKLAQMDLGVTADGIVGPKTRAAAKKVGVTLPLR